MVHGDGTRADGCRSGSGAKSSQIVGSRDGRAARDIVGSRSNVVVVQPGWMDRPTTETPQTQIYFTTHRSGAFPVLRVRTVARGERAWSGGVLVGSGVLFGAFIGVYVHKLY